MQFVSQDLISSKCTCEIYIYKICVYFKLEPSQILKPSAMTLAEVC